MYITESLAGRVFEITPEGEIVWEYLNDDLSDDGKSRQTIWRMTRLGAQEVRALAWPDALREKLAESGF